MKIAKLTLYKQYQSTNLDMSSGTLNPSIPYTMDTQPETLYPTPTTLLLHDNIFTYHHASWEILKAHGEAFGRHRHSQSLKPRVLVILRRAFTYAGPPAWNSLPEHLRAPDLTLNSFRHSLKTFLFTQMTHAAH